MLRPNFDRAVRLNAAEPGVVAFVVRTSQHPDDPASRRESGIFLLCPNTERAVLAGGRVADRDGSVVGLQAEDRLNEQSHDFIPPMNGVGATGQLGCHQSFALTLSGLERSEPGRNDLPGSGFPRIFPAFGSVAAAGDDLAERSRSVHIHGPDLRERGLDSLPVHRISNSERGRQLPGETTAVFGHLVDDIEVGDGCLFGCLL